MFASSGRQPQIDTQNVAEAGNFELILRLMAFVRKFLKMNGAEQMIFGKSAEIGRM